VVTGGSGFIGAFLVRRLVSMGWRVCVVDNLLRGDANRLNDVINDIEFLSIDVRDESKLINAFKNTELVIHLAAVNGTENFYNNPELVLDVGVRGMLAVVNACKYSNVQDLVIASTAEVYQTPSIIPTPETIPLMLPDSLNPRYSYGGSKIISELIAFNYFRDHFRKLQIFRPHNIYGPNMGFKHVIPQLICKIFNSNSIGLTKKISIEIQGKGKETRAFCYVDDVVNGIIKMYEKGAHREIYHIGNDEEVSILNLINIFGDILDKRIAIEITKEALGGTHRRCPDISKMKQIGYSPQISLRDGLIKTIDWYKKNYNDYLTKGLL
jgi:UDP-glucose 4-epimerase